MAATMQRRRTIEEGQPEPRVRVVRWLAFLVVVAILLYTMRDSGTMRFVADAARHVIRFL